MSSLVTLHISYQGTIESSCQPQDLRAVHWGLNSHEGHQNDVMTSGKL